MSSKWQLTNGQINDLNRDQQEEEEREMETIRIEDNRDQQEEEEREMETIRIFNTLCT